MATTLPRLALVIVIALTMAMKLAVVLVLVLVLVQVLVLVLVLTRAAASLQPSIVLVPMTTMPYVLALIVWPALTQAVASIPLKTASQSVEQLE